MQVVNSMFATTYISLGKALGGKRLNIAGSSVCWYPGANVHMEVMFRSSVYFYGNLRIKSTYIFGLNHKSIWKITRSDAESTGTVHDILEEICTSHIDGLMQRNVTPLL